MIRRILYLSVILSLTVATAFAQRISVEMSGQPIEQLFELIEKQTGARIYCTPAQADTLKVTVSALNEEPLNILRRALTGTPCKVTAYRNIFFILPEKELVATLPDNYYSTETCRKDAAETALNPLIDPEEEQSAVSEQKVYEIGNAKAPKTGMITLSGNITDIKTGEPLLGVSLFIENPMIGVTTDGYGYFSIQLPAGRHELIIRGLEVKETKRQLMLYGDGKLNVELEEKVYALKDVVVLGTKDNNIKATAIGVEYLTMKNIKNIPTAFGEADVLRIVMALPGVKSTGEISSGFNVRGGATDQNLILYNGGTIYNPTHLFGMFSAFNPDVVNDMELYKSSIPAKYGGRISSVLDINNREGNKKEFQGAASLGLLTSRLTLEGPILRRKGTFILGGRTTYSDWILGKLPEKSGYRDGSAGFYDLNGTLVYTANEQNKIFINGYFSKDRFAFDTTENYAYRNINLSVRWRRVHNPSLIHLLTTGYDRYDHRMNRAEHPFNAYSLTYKINQGFIKSDFSWFPANHHSVTFGFGATLYNLTPGEYLPDGAESLIAEDRIPNEKALESAVYISDEWEATPKFSVSAGLRYAVFNALGPRECRLYMEEYLPSETTLIETRQESGIVKTYHSPEIRIAARYAFNDQLAVKAGFNTMRQHIHKISNSTIMSPTDTWKLSDNNIRPQTGIQLSAGIFKNFPKVETSVEIYYKTINNYLDYRQGAVLVMNRHIETDVLETEGQSYGIELMVKKTTGKLNGWVSYTFARTMLRQADPKIALPANNRQWYPADFDKPHEIKFTGNYKITHRYSFSLNLEYSTGRPITLPAAKYIYAGGQYIYYTNRNQYRIPDYFRIDMSFNIEPSHHLTLLTHSALSFGIYNLTARKNAYSVYYLFEAGQINGYKMSVLGTIIPFISYNIKF